MTYMPRRRRPRSPATDPHPSRRAQQVGWLRHASGVGRPTSGGNVSSTMARKPIIGTPSIRARQGRIPRVVVDDQLDVDHRRAPRSRAVINQRCRTVIWKPPDPCSSSSAGNACPTPRHAQSAGLVAALVQAADEADHAMIERLLLRIRALSPPGVALRASRR